MKSIFDQDNIFEATLDDFNQTFGPYDDRSVEEGGKGYSCIAEQRMVETLRYGKPFSEYLKFGDRISIESLDNNNQSIFGKIEQVVEKKVNWHI